MFFGISSRRTKSAARKCPRLPTWIAGLPRAAQKEWQPADLEVGAGADEQIGIACRGDQAGPRLQRVRVLEGGCRDSDRHVFTRNLAGECTPFGLTGEDLKCPCRHRCKEQGKYNQDSVHAVLLKLVRAVRADAHNVLQVPLVIGFRQHTVIRVL